MSFKDALAQSAVLRDGYRSGLGALKGQDRAKVQAQDSRKISGSVDIDSSLKVSCPQDPRWDYCIAYDNGKVEVAYYVEIHPGETKEVSAVIAKLDFLEKVMAKDASELWRMERLVCWVASGRVNVPMNDRRRKKLAQRGIQGPMRGLILE